MSELELIKPRLGIFYSDEAKDVEVQGMIDAAKLYFKRAGWDITEPDALGIEAIAVFCKMAQSTDPAMLTEHPVLRHFIIQGRMENEI